MSHKSENLVRLERKVTTLDNLNDLHQIFEQSEPSVFLLHFPAGRTDSDAANSTNYFSTLSDFANCLDSASTVCILTTPPDAARLLLQLESSLKFQLWVSVKLKKNSKNSPKGILPENHVTLLVLTRYRTGLRHTITRIEYSYCPACGKTTKDYGGKKHIYNPYGTLISDVWRDITCSPSEPAFSISDRLQDLFGQEPYKSLHVLDMRKCRELLPHERGLEFKEDKLPLQWGPITLPPDSRLINDDCLTAMRAMPEGSVDFCFADPPYNLQKKYDHWDDGLESKKYFDWCDEWLSEMARVLKPGRTLAVINIPLWAVRHYQFLCTRLNFQSWICWDGLSFPVRMIMPSNYAIICFSKGEPRTLPGLDEEFLNSLEGRQMLPQEEFFCVRSSCISQRRSNGISDRAALTDLWSDIHRLKHNSRRVDHPCQLPPTLMRRLFSLYTRPRETVLDCFNGAGTSTLVAQQMKRGFIGIELSAQYHALALERHERLSRGEDPFGKQEATPKAKNSRVERLPKQKYVVSKKVLQLEVRQIAQEVGHIPTRDEVVSLSKYPIEYFDKYFVSWGEVCAAARHAGMTEKKAELVHSSQGNGFNLR